MKHWTNRAAPPVFSWSRALSLWKEYPAAMATTPAATKAIHVAGPAIPATTPRTA